MQTVLACFRFGHRQEIERQALRGVQRGIALGMHLDRAAEQATPPVCQPRRVGAVNRECGDPDNSRCLLTHAVLLLGTGYAPAVDGLHAESKPYRMLRKAEQILPALSMRSNKALPALEHFWPKSFRKAYHHRQALNARAGLVAAGAARNPVRDIPDG